MSDIYYQECKLIFNEGEEEKATKLKATELIEFLSFFNQVYSFLNSEEISDDLKNKIDNALKEKPPTVDDIKGEYFYKELVNCLERHPHHHNCPICSYHGLDAESDLKITSISYNSPLDMNLQGLIYPLVIAIIISGGEIKMGMFEFKLNSLAECLKSNHLKPLKLPNHPNNS